MAEVIRNKYIAELKVIQSNGDTEVVHDEADSVLCNLLIDLGYQDVVDEWEKIDKWYA